MPTPDKPKTLGDIKVKKERTSQLQDPHVAALTDYVNTLRDEMGEGVSIPFFDPWDAGVNAEILYLLEAPGAKAVESGFISRNNPDESAKNIFELSQEAGIDRKRSLLWNVVPWYIGSGSKIRPALSKDIEQGRKPLKMLFNLLPKLKVVILLGKKSQKNQSLIKDIAPSLIIVNSPHPSPLYVNNAPENRNVILSCFKVARSHLL